MQRSRLPNVREGERMMNLYVSEAQFTIIVTTAGIAIFWLWVFATRKQRRGEPRHCHGHFRFGYDPFCENCPDNNECNIESLRHRGSER